MTDIADWSKLPKDMYVVSVKTTDGIVYDATMCSVPMVTVPEVRYVQAAGIERLRAALEVCDRVLHFDLRKMITWGNDYNQAVKDAADAARTALGEKP